MVRRSSHRWIGNPVSSPISGGKGLGLFCLWARLFAGQVHGPSNHDAGHSDSPRQPRSNERRSPSGSFRSRVSTGWL